MQQRRGDFVTCRYAQDLVSHMMMAMQDILKINSSSCQLRPITHPQHKMQVGSNTTKFIIKWVGHIIINCTFRYC